MIYKLGELVDPVTETNSDLKYGLDDIVGVTIEKEMITTIANLTETDLDKFIVVRPYDFIYNPRTHGKKIGLGYNTTNRNYIATWNNNVFRIKKNMQNIILPDYLYMYFLRERWDKEACFHSWGSSTVVFLWESFCNMQINLPSIEEQRKIVSDYKVITDRIELLEKINANLEEQASLLYNTMIKTISIDKIESNEWISKPLKDIVDIVYGKGLLTSELMNEGYPVYGGNGIIGFFDKYLYQERKVLVSCRGIASGKVMFSEPYSFVTSNSLVLNIIDEKYPFEFVLYTAYNLDFYSKVSGSAQPQLTVESLDDMKVVIPDDKTLFDFVNTVRPIINLISIHNKEISTLKTLRENILKKLSKGE